MPRSRPFGRRFYDDAALTRLALVATLIGLATCGCGTASSKIATSPIPRPTKAQYIAESDAICRAARPAAEALKAQIIALAGKPEGVPLQRKLDSLISAGYGKLRALPKPPGEAPVLDRLLTALSASLTNASNALNALASHQVGKADAYLAVAKREATLARGLRNYGFRACGVAD